MTEDSAAALVQEAAAISMPPAALLPAAGSALPPISKPEPSPRKTPPRRSRFPWALALLALMAVYAFGPLLLLIGTATIAIPVLFVAILVSLACWKVADVIGLGARGTAPVSGNKKG